MYTLTFDHITCRIASLMSENGGVVPAASQPVEAKLVSDYIYLIEGRHGDIRYHIHLVLRNSDFSPAELGYLWKYGEVDDEPLLLGPYDTYRRTAKYWNKEASDGITVPVGAGPGLPAEV